MDTCYGFAGCAPGVRGMNNWLKVPCLAALLCGQLSYGRTDERPIVAVFNIQGKGSGLGAVQLRSLTEYLATSIAEGGVFRVVPPGDIQRLLTERTRESYKHCYDHSCQIELGRKLAANKSLSASILRIGDRCTFVATLYDLKTQTTDFSAKDKCPCSQIGVSEAIDRVAARIRAWAAGTSGRSDFSEGAIGDRPADWKVASAQEVIVRFSSEPTGAVVLVDGKLLCTGTPCSRAVAEGAHLVSMQAERYRDRRERVVLTRGSKLHFNLDPEFGWLTVRSRPTGMDVEVNGEKVGRTPLVRRETAPGGYEVLVVSPCHYQAGERVRCEAGQERTVSVDLKDRQGAVDVRARDEAGNDLEAEVMVDEVRLGKTPGVFKVSVCARELVIKHPSGVGRTGLAVKENQKSEIRLVLAAERRPMVRIPAGEFPMGSPSGSGDYDEHPQHTVWLDAFRIDKYEVAVGQYARCIQAGECRPPRRGAGCNHGQDSDDHPVNCIDWQQASQYCRWAGKRLCSEAEWERAARGENGRRHPWGEHPPTCGREAVCGVRGTMPVGSTPAGASAAGAVDMSGNVWEWVADWYDQAYYQTSPRRNPAGPETGSRRANRGGGFSDNADRLYAADRWWADPSFQGANQGVRCCASQ